jgi:hypothetical protein
MNTYNESINNIPQNIEKLILNIYDDNINICSDNKTIDNIPITIKKLVLPNKNSIKRITKIPFDVKISYKQKNYFEYIKNPIVTENIFEYIENPNGEEN